MALSEVSDILFIGDVIHYVNSRRLSHHFILYLYFLSINI
jgi:hypothetical protein